MTPPPLNDALLHYQPRAGRRKHGIGESLKIGVLFQPPLGSLTSMQLCLDAPVLRCAVCYSLRDFPDVGRTPFATFLHQRPGICATLHRSGSVGYHHRDFQNGNHFHRALDDPRAVLARARPSPDRVRASSAAIAYLKQYRGHISKT